MADLVHLGFAVDSASLVGASKALNAMTAAAKPAAVATAELNKASRSNSLTAQLLGGELNNLTRAHVGLSTQAMAAQHSMRSMIEMMILGATPVQVLGSQINHLTYAATGPGGLKGAFTDALGSFRAFITPATVIAGGLAAIGAGAIAAVANDQSVPANYQGIDVDADPDVVIWSIGQVLEMQRHTQLPDHMGAIGGFAQLSTVSMEGVSQRILHRWSEDQTGAPLKPAPIDWQQWHRNNPKPKTNRLKREMLERKARKAGLRVVR
ncbi:hypothetical protein [Nitrobacter sp.]|uniref:hypothetical protein n=1 Tax=Nitrobacter sp. TaxID=29420 RepID=UPI003F64C5FE